MLIRSLCAQATYNAFPLFVPLHLVFEDSKSVEWIEVITFTVWAMAFAAEAVADTQLRGDYTAAAICSECNS